MREQLKQYVELLFAGTTDSSDMKQEILQNTLERYDDLVAQGKTPEAAYRLAISGIGDINEVLGSNPTSPAPAVPVAEPGRAEKNKKLRAVSIGMYICCVLPVIILGNVGNGILGVCMMFLLIAAATVLMIMASDDEAEKKKEAQQRAQQSPLEKTLNSVTLAVFLVLSFITGAWHITWLIWPIMGAVKGIIRACKDLKGGSER